MDSADGNRQIDRHKRNAAREAIDQFVASGMTVGLGSGSTAAHFIDLLGQRLTNGSLNSIRGVATSLQSEKLAKFANIPLIDPRDTPRCDVVVDGADEVAPSLDLIKGLGGALVREKVVAQASTRRVIIIDESKLVSTLGLATPLPVEVMSWGHQWQVDFLRSTGGEPVLRLDQNGDAFVTDNGNLIYDVRYPGISDPDALQTKLLNRAGIVQTGLFLGIADVVLVARASEVERLDRK